MSDTVRDHLFVSYATEDAGFAEWLSLRLTTEGYRVWCDRIKLLGGESYPRDIDAAIKHRTFRFIALLSPSSLQKPNPLKERTLALNLGRQRGEQFLIPLNLTGLRADELDWMTSDLTFIPFLASWADGLAQLLKALDKAGAPRTMPDGGGAVAQHIAARSVRRFEPERLWSNVIQIDELPQSLIRVEGSPKAINDQLADVPRYPESSTVSWVFELPELTDGLSTNQFSWRGKSPYGGLWLPNAATNLLRQYIARACLTKGMALFEEEGKPSQPFFPPDGEAARWLTYKKFDGSKGRLKATGERNFWVGQDVKETTRYHVAPVFMPLLDLFTHPAFILRIRLHLTDVQGRPLPLRKAISRRKKVCANWWNDDWLARVQAVLYWLTAGQPLNLAVTPECRIMLSPEPVTATVDEGIDEASSKPVIDDDGDLVDDEEEGGFDD